MGVGYETAEAEAYLHRWCVAGHLLGIDDDLLPLSLDDAQEITTIIRRRQRRPSEDGRVLGQALVNALQASVHFKIMRPLPPSLIRWYVGKDVARINGIDGHESLSKVLDSSVAMMRRTRFGAPYDRALNLLLRRLSAHAGRTTLKAFDNAGRAGERGTFPRYRASSRRRFGRSPTGRCGFVPELRSRRCPRAAHIGPA